ncbi:MAG: hypothetical protein ACRDN0_20840 [Trebonia sp.]
MAARRAGQSEATALLASLVHAGFSQPELFDGEMGDALADDPRRPEISAAMAASPVPVPIALTDWPVLKPAAPLGPTDLTHVGRA